MSSGLLFFIYEWYKMKKLNIYVKKLFNSIAQSWKEKPIEFFSDDLRNCHRIWISTVSHL